jgi:hypothetical protein
MPYVYHSERDKYEKSINEIVDQLIDVFKHSNNIAKGHLNYVIFTIIKRLLPRIGMNYANAQDFIGGVLTCCQLELYRRILVPYEDEKIEEMGDVI